MTERSPIMKTFDRFHHWIKERPAVHEDFAVITAAVLTLAWVVADVFPTSFDWEKRTKGAMFSDLENKE